MRTAILKYVVRRLLLMLPTLALIIFITFTLGFFAPGDPIRLIFGEDHPQNEEIVQRLRHQYGLDRPYVVQLGDYALKMAHGDFGKSIALNRGVGETMWHALPVSAQVAGASLVLIIVIGIPLGILAAVRQNSGWDYGILFGAIAFNSTPAFVLAPLLMILLILDLHLLPSTVGWDGLFSYKAILPVFTLAIGYMLGVIRYTRASVLEVLNQDYVRTARAKGLPQRLVVARHILKNSMTPVLTALGLSVPGLITSSIFLENIFAIPGFGKLTIDSQTGHDFPMIIGTTTIAAFLVIVSNLIVDLLYGVLDPRVRVRYE